MLLLISPVSDHWSSHNQIDWDTPVLKLSGSLLSWYQIIKHGNNIKYIQDLKSTQQLTGNISLPCKGKVWSWSVWKIQTDKVWAQT